MVIWLQVNVFHGHMDGLLQREHRSRRCFCSGWIGERKSSTLSRRRFPLPKLIEGFEVAGPPLVVVLVYSHPLPPGRRRWNIEATSRTGYYWLQVQRLPWAYGLREREREASENPQLNKAAVISTFVIQSTCSTWTWLNMYVPSHLQATSSSSSSPS